MPQTTGFVVGREYSTKYGIQGWLLPNPGKAVHILGGIRLKCTKLILETGYAAFQIMSGEYSGQIVEIHPVLGPHMQQV